MRAIKFRPRYIGYGFAIVGIIYLVLGVILAFQVSNTASAAKQLRQTVKESDSKVFAESYQEFSNRLSSFSSLAGNPVWAPLFLLAGTPSTFSHERAILHSSSVIAKSLIPVFSGPGEKSPGLQTNIELLQRTAPTLSTVSPEIQTLLHNVAMIHLGGLLSPFNSKLTDVRKTAAASSIVAERVLPMLPSLSTIIGSESPRTYLVAFQNPAEARGVGGIIGSYAIVRMDAGKFTIRHVGSNVELKSSSQLPIKMPVEYGNLYGNDPAIWQNSNLSPHFPYAAKIWLALWQQQHNERLDGVITFDPLVLRQILVATGPIFIQGEEINAGNVVRKTMSDAYIRYAADNNARKMYLVAIINGVLSRLENGQNSGRDLIVALSSSIAENRIVFYSDHAKEQAAVEKSAISGSLSSANDDQYRLVINNIAGNKMDYYLMRSVSITALTCGEKRKTRVDFTLENSVARNLSLPSYVNGRIDLGKPNGVGNSTSVEAMIFGPRNSTLLESKNTPEIDANQLIGTELGHPVLAMNLELKPRVPVHVTATFKGGAGAITNIVQPLVNPEKVLIKDKCGR